MSFLSGLFSSKPAHPPLDEVARRVAAGTAVLIDVREADEWAETGVAEPALTLAMSALRGSGDAWKPVLEANKERELFLYCHSGGRSGRVAEVLTRQGYRAFNIGGFADWARAGLPVRKV